MPIVDLNSVQLDEKPDYNNPQVAAKAILDLYGEQPALPSGQIVDLNSIQLDQPAPPADTLKSRLQADFQKRKDAMNQSAVNYISGKQGLGSTYLQTAGNIAGGVLDTAGEAIKSGYAALPDAIKPRLTDEGRAMLDTVKQGIGNAANYVSDSAVGDVARQYANDYPVAMKNIGAVGNIASVVPMGTAAKMVGASIAEAAGKGIARGAKKLATPKQVLPNSDQLAEIGVKAYDKARASGEVFNSEVSSGFVGAIDKAKPAKIAGAVETDLSQALESGLGKYRDLAGKPLSIDDIDIIDKDLSNLKDQAYNAGKNQLGSELANIQNFLRGSVADAPSGQALAEGRDFFRKKYQMEDVERIFRNAEGRPNEAAIIQTGYRNLANQARKKGSGYTKEQIGLMDKAAKGGLSIDALKLMSSKLIPAVAGASGNFAGAGAAYMGNIAAGAGATALQTAKANKLAKSIVKDLRVPGEPTLLNRAAAKLTKKDMQDAFEAKKSGGPQLLLPAPSIEVSPSGFAATISQREVLGRGTQPIEKSSIAAKSQVDNVDNVSPPTSVASTQWQDGLSPRTVRDLESPSSYMVRNRETGQVMREISPESVPNLNTEKYEAVPIIEHLANLNGQSYRAAGLSETAKRVYSTFRKEEKKP